MTAWRDKKRFEAQINCALEYRVVTANVLMHVNNISTATLYTTNLCSTKLSNR